MPTAQIRSPQSAQEATLARAKTTILPSVEYETTDVREALRQLFRRGLIGGTIAPEVQGSVTMSLRMVDWETALQNVTRRVDATYRVRNGWVEVVPREDTSSFYSPMSPSPIAGAYDRFSRLIAAGDGKGVDQLFGPALEARNATTTKRNESARRALIETMRAYPHFRIEQISSTWKRRVPLEQAVIAYERPHGPPVYFRDFWQESATGWRLVAREETVRGGGVAPRRSFRNTPLSQVLHAMLDDAPIAWKLDPALDRPVTIELQNETFETVLTRIVRELGLTYRIEGGVYEIVAREP